MINSISWWFMPSWTISVRLVISFCPSIMSKMVKDSIHRHAFDYTQGVVIVSIKDWRNRNPSNAPSLFEAQGGRSVLSPNVEAAPADGQDRFAAFAELSFLEMSLRWKALGLQVSLCTRKESK